VSWRSSRAAAGVAGASWDEKVYAVGGHSGLSLRCVGTVYETVEVYDPLTDSWATLASMPEPVTDAYATVAYQGKLYVFGGVNPRHEYVAFTQVQDVDTDSWSFAAPMPTARAAAMTGVIEGRVAVFGGKVPPDGDDGVPTNLVWAALRCGPSRDSRPKPSWLSLSVGLRRRHHCHAAAARLALLLLPPLQARPHERLE
jgi:hypothetical protein